MSRQIPARIRELQALIEDAKFRQDYDGIKRRFEQWMSAAIPWVREEFGQQRARDFSALETPIRGSSRRENWPKLEADAVARLRYLESLALTYDAAATPHTALPECPRDISAQEREVGPFRSNASQDTYHVIQNFYGQTPNINIGRQGDENSVETQIINTGNAKVGVQGGEGHSIGITFDGDVAVGALSSQPLERQLASLRAELKKHPDATPEQDAAIGKLAEAESALKKGEEPAALKQLAPVGHWVIEAATKIGASLATDAIKEQLGMK